MTTNPRREAALALHRFGFGPVPGSLAAIAYDPREALLADLERPGAGRVAAANLPNSGQAARAFFEFRAERQAKEKLAQRAKKETEVVGAADDNAMKPSGDAQPPKPDPAQIQQDQQPQLPAQLVQNEAKVRIEAAVAAEIGPHHREVLRQPGRAQIPSHVRGRNSVHQQHGPGGAARVRPSACWFDFFIFLLCFWAGLVVAALSVVPVVAGLVSSARALKETRARAARAEAIVRMLFGDETSTEALLAAVASVDDHARTLQARLVAISREYAEGRGLFPEHAHVLGVAGRFAQEYLAAMQRWAEWATAGQWAGMIFKFDGWLV